MHHVLNQSGGSLTIPITSDHVVAPFDQTLSSGFLHGAGVSLGGDQTDAGTGTIYLVSAGSTEDLNFSLAAGDKLDLSQILAGAPLSSDLTNIGRFVQVIGHGPNDPGFGAGTKTVLEISGPNGSSIVNLESSGRLNLHDLLKNNTFLPPHS